MKCDEVKLGMRLEAQSANGRWLPAKVVELPARFNDGRYLVGVVFLSPGYSAKSIPKGLDELRVKADS